ncbi:MAG: FkbM family methyltransferase [Acidobacteria bacterium]|nr:FkbM family methyltransferase [Acidobacteriota bacterium]
MTSEELVGGPLVYVDCGARGVRGNRLLRTFRRSEYLGFEPDADECARLIASGKKRRRYFPVALAGARGTRRFYVTRSAACASLLPPNGAFVSRFLGCAPLFEVVDERDIETVTLDDYLRSQGVTAVDVLELDTQGSELEILRGAEGVLRDSVLALQVEVEFAPMYIGQPLFGEIDSHLRARGFSLFDLARYRGRRTTLAPHQPTRGQLLWGQALYFRDHERLATPQEKLRLALLASFYECDDYALEIVEQLPDLLSSTELASATALRRRLRRGRAARLVEVLRRLDRSPLRGLFRRLGRSWVAAAAAFVTIARDGDGTWRD